MSEKQYTKLSALVDDKFTITEAYGFTWKKWDDVNKKMLMSDNYEEGYRKVYAVNTDKGVLDLGSGQLGNLLEAVYYKGEANLINKTFQVKSNGKTGMDIRYYFNVARSADPKLTQNKVIETVLEDIPDGERVNIADIPF